MATDPRALAHDGESTRPDDDSIEFADRDEALRIAFDASTRWSGLLDRLAKPEYTDEVTTERES